MSRQKELGFNPWLGFWARPGRTTRRLNQEKSRLGLLFTTFLWGVVNFYLFVTFFTPFCEWTPSFALFITLLGSFMFGFLGLGVFSLLLQITGRFIGGRGSLGSLYRAVAWGQLPHAFTLAIWVALFIRDGFLGFDNLILIITGVLTLLTYAYMVITIAETQRISYVKALVNIALAVLVSAPVFLLSFLMFKACLFTCLV